MKKIILALLLVGVCVCVVGCSKGEKLTLDNYKTYLTIKGSSDYSGNKYKDTYGDSVIYDSYTFYAKCEGADGYEYKDLKIHVAYTISYYPTVEKRNAGAVWQDPASNTPETLSGEFIISCNINGNGENKYTVSPGGGSKLISTSSRLTEYWPTKVDYYISEIEGTVTKR